MVTDAALYRYPYYHTAQATPDKVTFQHFIEASHGLGISP
jgi:hypothetical protein